MSATVHLEYTQREAIAELEQVLGRRIPKATFYRWLTPALIPGPKHFYVERDLLKLAFVARYLERDRNLDRAQTALAQYLSQQVED